MTETTQSSLAETIAARAENLYRTRQHLCADAVLLAFNEGLGGGLTEQQAVGLTSGLSIGQGGAGCLCGAVSGGALVLGLFMGGEGRAYRNTARVREAVNALHTRFKEAHRSTCCRVLTKAVKDDEAAHFEQCAGLTGDAARMVADILFDVRPELAQRADRERLAVRDSKGRGLLRRVFNRLFR
jgi:C_GCAxxG_C_C family probable redox protein